MTRQHVGWVVGACLLGLVLGLIELPVKPWSYMGPEHTNWPLSIAALGVGIALVMIGVRKSS